MKGHGRGQVHSTPQRQLSFTHDHQTPLSMAGNARPRSTRTEDWCRLAAELVASASCRCGDLSQSPGPARCSTRAEATCDRPKTHSGCQGRPGIVGHFLPLNHVEVSNPVAVRSSQCCVTIAATSRFASSHTEALQPSPRPPPSSSCLDGPACLRHLT